MPAVLKIPRSGVGAETPSAEFWEDDAAEVMSPAAVTDMGKTNGKSGLVVVSRGAANDIPEEYCPVGRLQV
jgi:hypothetical protein